MYDVFKKQYNLAPSHFRKEVKHQNTKGNKDIIIKIGYHLPYRYNEILNFLKSRAIYGIEKIEKGKGIGEWTAKYIAMRTMNDTDILLDSDYAIKKIMKKYKLNTTVFEKYKPFRSYITVGIWNSLEDN